MSAFLDAVQARLDAATPQFKRIAAPELADTERLLAFARDVKKLAQDAPHNGPFTAHGYTLRLHLLLAGLNERDES